MCVLIFFFFHSVVNKNNKTRGTLYTHFFSLASRFDAELISIRVDGMCLYVRGR